MLHDSNHIKNILFASKQSVNIKHEVSIKLLAGLARLWLLKPCCEYLSASDVLLCTVACQLVLCVERFSLALESMMWQLVCTVRLIRDWRRKKCSQTNASHSHRPGYFGEFTVILLIPIPSGFILIFLTIVWWGLIDGYCTYEGTDSIGWGHSRY